MDWFYCHQCNQWAIDCPDCEYGTTCNGGCGCEEVWEYYENHKPPTIKQNQKLIDALKFYASGEHFHEEYGRNGGYSEYVLDDKGEIAQQALDDIDDT